MASRSADWAMIFRIGSTIARMDLSLATVCRAASGLSQKFGEAISPSTAASASSLLGKSKRVPDRDDPGRKVLKRFSGIFV